MPALDPNFTATLVETLDDALDMRAWLGERRDWLGVDIETSGVNLGKDDVRLFQVGDVRRGFALSWEDWKGVVKETIPAYRGSQIVIHNATFDIAFLKRDGVHIREELVDDTMIMGHLVNSAGRIGLKPLAAKLCGQEALMGQGMLEDAMQKFGWDWGSVPTDYPAYWQYGILDTALCAALAAKLWPEVKAEYKFVYEVEMACVHVLVGSRLRGMKIDLDYTRETSASMQSEMAELEQRIPFAPSKDKAVREYIENLADRGPLGGWWPFRTEKGDVSVDDDALEYFEDQFPEVITPLRRWRRCSFLVGHYFNNLLRENVGGVVRPNIRQVLRTGRMSITDPPLQTLPRGTEVRDAFVARDGCKLLLADYRQMELRVIASYAQCEGMLEAFRRDEDMHTFVGAMVYCDGDQSKLTKPQRQVSKSVNFAKGYGAGDAKIALTAGVDIGIIQDFQAKYNLRFPEVTSFMQTLIGEMHRRKKEDGTMWAKTVLGRRVVVDDDKPYVAMNYIVQGGSADVLKLKLVELDAAGVGDYIMLPVHDELLLEVPDEDLDEARRIVEQVMPEKYLFDCPLTIDTDIVSKWGNHYR